MRVLNLLLAFGLLLLFYSLRSQVRERIKPENKEQLRGGHIQLNDAPEEPLNHPGGLTKKIIISSGQIPGLTQVYSPIGSVSPAIAVCPVSNPSWYDNRPIGTDISGQQVESHAHDSMYEVFFVMSVNMSRISKSYVLIGHWGVPFGPASNTAPIIEWEHSMGRPEDKAHHHKHWR